MKSLLFAIAILALTIMPAYANTETGAATIAGTLANSCTVAVTTSPSAFTLVPGATPAQTTGALAPTCTNGDAYTVALDTGGHGTGTGTSTPTRNMANGASESPYQLYSNSGDTAIWGNDVGVNTVAGTGNGSAQSITFWVDPGLVPTTSPAGTYSDTITVTVTY